MFQNIAIIHIHYMDCLKLTRMVHGTVIFRANKGSVSIINDKLTYKSSCIQTMNNAYLVLSTKAKRLISNFAYRI